MSGISRSTPLDSAQMELIQSIYEREPVARACFARITAALFSGGITLAENHQNLAHDFRDHLDQKWVPFACDLLLGFMKYGFCPYVINKTRDQSTRRIIKYPVAVQIENVQINVEIDDDYERVFTVFRRHRNGPPNLVHKPDPRVKLAFAEYSSRPSGNGRLNSDLSTLVTEIQNVDELLEYALRSESYRTHPTLFVQSTPDTRKFEEISHLRAFDDDFVEEARTERTHKTTFDRYAAMSHAEGFANTQSTPVYSNRTGRMLPSHDKIWKNNIFSVPDGSVLVRTKTFILLFLNIATNIVYFYNHRQTTSQSQQRGVTLKL